MNTKTTDQTPAQRKAEAFKRLCGQLVDYSDESVEAIAELERACIAEAVAPALEYAGKTIDMMKAFESSPVVMVDGMILCLERVRRLLTEGRE